MFISYIAQNSILLQYTSAYSSFLLYITFTFSYFVSNFMVLSRSFKSLFMYSFSTIQNFLSIIISDLRTSYPTCLVHRCCSKQWDQEIVKFSNVQNKFKTNDIQEIPIRCGRCNEEKKEIVVGKIFILFSTHNFWQTLNKTFFSVTVWFMLHKLDRSLTFK